MQCTVCSAIALLHTLTKHTKNWPPFKACICCIIIRFYFIWPSLLLLYLHWTYSHFWLLTSSQIERRMHLRFACPHNAIALSLPILFFPFFYSSCLSLCLRLACQCNTRRKRLHYNRLAPVILHYLFNLASLSRSFSLLSFSSPIRSFLVLLLMQEA